MKTTTSNYQNRTTMIDFSQFDSLLDLILYFSDEAKCIAAIVESRWGKGDDQDVICPYCNGHHCVTRKDGKFRCNACKRNFSCRVGTIFEDSNLPLYKWFIAMYLISSHKKGISSCQLARDIHTNQSTAWYILQKIRALYAQDDSVALKGEVECDEVYIGGKEKWKHKSMKTPKTQGRSTKTKTPVFGMMERTKVLTLNGYETMTYVHAIVVENTNRDTLMPIVQQFVKEGTTVFTDELNSYKHLNELGYDHKVCNHSNFEFVCEGKNYTNNIEGFWSHFRRMIIGCYHNVSDEHLQSYVDEACFRWNTRKTSESDRFTQMFATSIGLVKLNREFILCNAA